MTIVTDSFAVLAKMEAETFGIPHLPTLVIPHPVATLDEDNLSNLADDKMRDVWSIMFQEITDEPETKMTIQSPLTVRVEDDLDRINKLFVENRWSDGLPVIPPTKDRVQRFIDRSGYQSDRVIGLVAPQNGLATVHNVAVNCVMAGCKPEYMPVVLAALEAMVEPAFNLRGVQTTTHPCAPLVIVNGPIAKQIGMNGSANTFGQGNHANATIGRAIRLVLQNIGGALPGNRDRSTQGQPSKYSYCIAENEDMNPWGPLRADFNYCINESTVTVIAGENPHNINDHYSSRPEGLLSTIVDSCCTMGMNNIYLTNSQVVLCLCPEHAKILADHSWDKNRIKEHVFLNARKTVGKLKTGGMFNMREWPAFVNPDNDEDTVPLVQSPNDIYMIVAGGVGKHSSFIPSFGLSKAVTKPVKPIV